MCQSDPSRLVCEIEQQDLCKGPPYPWKTFHKLSWSITLLFRSYINWQTESPSYLTTPAKTQSYYPGKISLTGKQSIKRVVIKRPSVQNSQIHSLLRLLLLGKGIILFLPLIFNTHLSLIYIKLPSFDYVRIMRSSYMLFYV